MSIARRNERIIYWATLAESINLLEPVLTLFFLHWGLSPFQVFMLWPVMAATNALAEVPTGAFADRYGPRTAFVTGSGFLLLSVSLLLVPAVWAVFLSRALWALGWTFFSGSQEALLYESLKETGEESRMSAVMGRVQSASFLPLIPAFLIGPYVARDLTEVQFQVLILLQALFLVAKLLLVSRVVNPRSFTVEAESPYRHVRSAVGVVRANPGLFRLFLHGTLVFIPIGVFLMWDQPYLTGSGLPVVYMGVFYAGGAAVSWLMSRFAGKAAALVPGKTLLLGTGTLSLLLLAGAALMPGSLLFAGSAFFLLRMVRAVREPVVSAMQNEYIPSGSRATTLSILSLLDSVVDIGLIPLVAAFSGAGLPAIFGACTVLTLVGLLVTPRPAPPREVAS